MPETSDAYVLVNAAHLRVDECLRVAAAGALPNRRNQRDHVVHATEDRRHRRVRQHERHFVVDEVAKDGPTVLRAERLKIPAHHGGRNAEVQQPHGVRSALQRPYGDRDVAHAARAVGERHADGARTDAGGVAGADGRVNDVRTGCRRSTWSRRSLTVRKFAACSRGRAETRDEHCDPQNWRRSAHEGKSCAQAHSQTGGPSLE